ncbi:hypothetical protein ACFOJ6_00475 [Gordonia humi]|uniref:hypothetical protein n=1 Tax=Gordonia humi TaxID=686429 RepID=UPI003619510A
MDRGRGDLRAVRGTVPDRTVADGYPRFMPTTRRTDASVEDFIAAVPNARRRDDTVAAVRLIRDTIGEDPSMWGAVDHRIRRPPLPHC